MKIGIDLGFGFVKVAPEGLNPFKFPTAIARFAGDGGLSEFSRCSNEDRPHRFEGESWLVGEAALGNDLPTRSEDFILRFAPVLVAHALRLCSHAQIYELKKPTLCVGLAMGHFQNPETRRRLIASLAEFSMDGITVTPQPIRGSPVLVAPQGLGIFVDWLRSDDGQTIPEHKTAKGMVLDIGFNTVDVLHFKSGAASNNGGSAMLDHAGISKIILALSNHVEKTHRISLSPHEAKQCFLTRELKLAGNVFDLSEVVRSLTRTFCDELSVLLVDRWSKEMMLADAVLLAGGGAYHVKDKLPKQLNGQVVYIELPEFSNARGFRKALN